MCLFYCIHGGLNSDGWFFVNCLFFLSLVTWYFGWGVISFFLLDIGNVLDYSSRRFGMKRHDILHWQIWALGGQF